ncbi:hypothetical protein C1645_95504 [Glomus cerebriforme]|uniref:Uncharacterized protein n=1 Tax=Glomus cerebriforme TaxID=658196 RepID=A0A397TMB0_9GLOM|nr:hypothetical protein C1645_95504 [Glomus cerebriforme]
MTRIDNNIMNYFSIISISFLLFQVCILSRTIFIINLISKEQSFFSISVPFKDILRTCSDFTDFIG